jgi:dipeptidyl aminopeptidase/acylaminoacyl peptidase
MLGWNASKLVFNTPVSPEWLDGDTFWYRKQVLGGHEFIYVDPSADVQRPAFDHPKLASALSAASGTSYEPYKLPFEEFEYVEGGKSARFWEDRKKDKEQETKNDDAEAEKEHRRWTCDLATYVCTGPENVAKDPKDEVKSPDGQWVAFSREENLWVRSTNTGKEVQVSKDGEEHFGYAVPAEGCCYTVTARREKTELRPIVFWSPDSKKIATYKLDERKVADMYLIETHEGRPILHSYRYALPGDTEIPAYTLHIFDIDSKSQVTVKGEPIEVFWGPGDNVDVRWSDDAKTIYFLREYRGHQKAVLYAADVATGELRLLVEDASETFLDLPSHQAAHQDRPLQEWRVINDGREVIWWSERDGWGHFYLFDAQTGAPKNQITAGAWVALDIHHVDEVDRWIYFNAYGKEESLYPYAAQLYRVHLDGSGLERLSREDAAHEIHMAESGRYVIDSYSMRDTAPVTVLRQNDGRVIRTLEEADISELEAAGWSPAEPFTVKARDGATNLYGFLYRPSSFNPEKKYPVIDYIYPGPQIGPVRHRGFTASPGGNAQALAELGFIVIHFDAMGTPFRSKAFHDVWYGDMGDNGIIDHVQTIKQLAARHPEIDIDRVGIFGHSGGGFSSTDAILRYPDFFKVAVSSAGNHDNRSYSFGWGEKYQGLLEKHEDGSDNYESQANHLLAKNLKGHLMLSYGSLDDNVHPNATLLLVNELIKHNKDFDMLVVPNGNHRYGRNPYVIRRTWDYFVRHLLGEEPPKGYRIEAPPS